MEKVSVFPEVAFRLSSEINRLPALMTATVVNSTAGAAMD
jgi:hypothetical protein